MNLSIIAIVGENNEIGKNNNLLCRLPADLKYFKELTTGHTVVMGRKTFESLPKGALPNRINIVLSRNKSVLFEGCLTFSSISEIVDYQKDKSEIFIIGGGEIYKQILPKADKLYLTKIRATFDDADTFFPDIDYSEWEEIKCEDHLSDEKNPYDFSFLVYKRK